MTLTCTHLSIIKSTCHAFLFFGDAETLYILCNLPRVLQNLTPYNSTTHLRIHTGPQAYTDNDQVFLQRMVLPNAHLHAYVVGYI